MIENIIKKSGVDIDKIKKGVSPYFYEDLISSFSKLFELDKKSFINDLLFVEKNIELIGYLEKIIHKEMIISMIPIKDGSQFTILYKGLYNIYIENKKKFDGFGIKYFSKIGGKRNILYEEDISNFTTLNKLGLKLVYTISFLPKSYSPGDIYEDGIGSLSIDYYIIESDRELTGIGIAKLYHYNKFYLSIHLYFTNNKLLISSIQGKNTYYEYINMYKSTRLRRNDLGLKIISFSHYMQTRFFSKSFSNFCIGVI